MEIEENQVIEMTSEIENFSISLCPNDLNCHSTLIAKFRSFEDAEESVSSSFQSCYYHSIRKSCLFYEVTSLFFHIPKLEVKFSPIIGDNAIRNILLGVRILGNYLKCQIRIFKFLLYTKY